MHTPGPWLFSPVNDCAVAIVEDDGTSIFDVTVCLHTTGQSALAANAALVAAAPDLLAALLEVVAEWDARHADEDHRRGYTLDTGGIAQARVAIAKATGA